MNFSSVSGKNWLLKKFDSSHVAKLVENYPLSEIAAKLLSIRKNNIENIDLFLNPKIKNLLPNPFVLKDMSVAIERIYKSITKDELIGIFGDYDVDGASSTAILARYFSSINICSACAHLLSSLKMILPIPTIHLFSFKAKLFISEFL